MKILDYLAKEYNLDKSVIEYWRGNVELWRSWYEGRVKKFHNYSIYNGRSVIKMQKLSLQMAKKCCEDWADIIFNERVRVEVDSETTNKSLFSLLESLNFWEFMNSAVEQSGATGTGAICLSMSELQVVDDEVSFAGATPVLDYVSIENVYPLSWSNGRVNECAFAVKKLMKGQFYVFLSVHTKGDSGAYTISNKVFKANKAGDVTALDEAALQEMSVVTEFNTGSDVPWFSLIKPAGTNNILPDSPFGLPHFAQAIDVLRRIDNTFDALQNEISLGRKRIFVREEMTTLDSVTGNEIRTFDPNDITVYILPKGFNADGLIQSENSELRVEALTKDLENSLAIFGDKCGFGVQYYQLDPAGQVREIGILTQNSKLIRRKKKHEIVLESAVFDIVKALMQAVGMDDTGLKITFDNDIIDDENERKKTALTEVMAGVKSKSEYRQEFFGEPEDVANAAVQKILDEASGFGEEVGVYDDGGGTNTD